MTENGTRNPPAYALPKMLIVPPRIKPAFDLGFKPMSLAFRSYQKAVRESGKAVPLKIAIERENGLISVFATEVLPHAKSTADATALYVERTIKFLLWSRGGWKILIHGPGDVAERIGRQYSRQGERAFDVGLMSPVYGKDFEVRAAGPDDFPSPNEGRSLLGGHFDGNRIGFDLGASDIKVAAVIAGKSVYSEEFRWTPGTHADPGYHYRRIRQVLKKAASHLPRVDAIGGSAAGIYLGNQVRIASLFRSVPPDVFDRKVKDMFNAMREEWGVPFEVANDGEVAALAGTLSLGRTAMLGLAMGSSEAAGFIDREGRLPGWLDELAFAPVDLSPDAVADEWSGDRGVGVSYFSQQAVNKLALRAGFSFPEEVLLPERLKKVQALAADGDGRARRVFEDIGIYLGYTIPLYKMYYDFSDALVLGRVMSAAGGDIIMAKAAEVLGSEFPEIEKLVRLHAPDERSRRVGQAVAAASLPAIDGR